MNNVSEIKEVIANILAEEGMETELFCDTDKDTLDVLIKGRFGVTFPMSQLANLYSRHGEEILKSVLLKAVPKEPIRWIEDTANWTLTVHTQEERERLEEIDVLFAECMDFIVAVSSVYDDMCAFISRNNLIRLDKSEEEVFDIAKENFLANIKRGLFSDLADGMSQELGMDFPIEKDLIYVTTKNCDNGSAVLMFPQVFKNICEELGAKELIIYPSSIHDVLILPSKEGFSTEEIFSCKVTQEDISGGLLVYEPEIFLSKNIYRYNAESDTLGVIL